MSTSDDIVTSGMYLYNGLVPVEVRITRGDTFYGSGDYEDLPEDRDDFKRTAFAVLFESTVQPGTFNVKLGQYRSLAEAIAAAEKSLGTRIEWR